MIYSLLLIVYNLLACKMTSWGIDLGITISWAVFLFGDVITEIKGEKEGYKLAKKGLIVNLLFSLIMWGACNLSSTSNNIDTAFSLIFNTNLRIVFSSCTAYLLGNFINVRIMSRCKGNYYFRAIFSTLLGQEIDNLLFYLLAFSPIGLSEVELPLSFIFLSSLKITALETLIEAIFSPIGHYICKKIKEGELKK